jgi:hypothetical protein
VPDALTPWSLAVLVVGGLMYAAMSVSTRSASSSVVRPVRRPGWIARRRARAGIVHRRDRVGIGYKSAVGAVHLTLRELAGHGAAFGGPGSGKTTFLQLLVEAATDQVPVVIVDPKGSPALAETVRAHGGQVWTLDGRLPADLLDPRPWQVPDLLLEAEDYSLEARAYRDAAHQRALWAAWALALQGKPMDLAQLRRLLDREALLRALEPHRGRDARIGEWLDRLGHQRGGIEDSGARGLDRALGVLLDGVAMRGSLRACAEALRLEDVLDTNGLVLFSLDVADYPHATRKVASWVLLGMGRLARQLGDVTARERAAQQLSVTPRALLLVDEVGALGSAARHLRGLVGRARESGLAVVLATQGPSDLEAVDHALLPQVLQDTAWQLAFRQGSPQDAERMQALFGKAWVNDESWSSDGRTMTRRVERPRVSIDEWMNALEPGDAWLRVAPIDKGWRQERVRVALPQAVPDQSIYIPAVSREPRLPGPADGPTEHGAPDNGDGGGVDNAIVGPILAGTYGHGRGYGSAGTGATTETCAVSLTVEQRFLEDQGAAAAFWARVEERGEHRRYWTGPRDHKGYGRVRWKGLELKAHRVVWTAETGPLPDADKWTLDHRCPEQIDKACCTPEHERLVPRDKNTGLRWERQKAAAAPAGFAIALFAGIDRPAVEQRAVSLDELRQLLGRFEVLADKRRGRCWSPTRYAGGASSRGNAGVLEVSALVFDMDRVPPEPERLQGVYWLGHTTWSHTALAPRWRVVIPLSAPVPAKHWADVWQRARAALCPEADPACKDPSRAYWLPSHSGGVTAKTTCHEGPLLDAGTLQALPAEQRHADELRRMPSAKVVRRTTDSDHRRGDAYMQKVIDNLAAARPGGRNAALNGAAWTLGRWIAAGALDQDDVEDELYDAAERNGLVDDDDDRQCWATIRSGLSTGLQQPIDLDADGRKPT